MGLAHAQNIKINVMHSHESLQMLKPIEFHARFNVTEVSSAFLFALM